MAYWFRALVTVQDDLGLITNIQCEILRIHVYLIGLFSLTLCEIVNLLFIRKF